MFVFRFALVAGAALAFSAPAPAQPAVQTIYLWSFNYAPKPIHLAAGRPVTLTFVNRSGGGHDFTARSFFRNARITSGMVMDGMVELHGNESKSVTLVPRAGTYKVHCSHFLHKQFGMTDLIIVN